MALYFKMSLFNRIIIGVFGVMCNDNLIMVDINKVPMVRVTWLDARDTETGWLDIKVGWMITNTSKKIVIMRSYSKDKDDISGGGAIAIPKGWITKIEYLEVSYAERNQN
jgi:hypothetical protein